MTHYTPDIQDLYFGYEFEQNDGNIWNKMKFGSSFSFAQMSKHIKLNAIRTRYLTKEDIEGEGWDTMDHDIYPIGEGGKVIGIGAKKHSIHERGDCTYVLMHVRLSSHLLISVQFKGHREYHTIYSGSCPSINELRTIQKLLKIK